MGSRDLDRASFLSTSLKRTNAGPARRPLDSMTSTTFSIVSSARARTSVILAGKSGSRRHFITNFSTNVVVAKTSYQMLEVLSFWDRENA